MRLGQLQTYSPPETARDPNKLAFICNEILTENQTMSELL